MGLLEFLGKQHAVDLGASTSAVINAPTWNMDTNSSICFCQGFQISDEERVRAQCR